MNEVQLYISGEKVELFKDEIISVNDTIQNVRDISKVFTAFSKQFNIPASRTNNKIFKHYYNYDIVGGFDARFKVDALIKLNGSDYKKGKLRLNSVSLKDNKPYSYKVVFFGETVTLSDLLGDDQLDTLGSELSNYNHPYTEAIVESGLRVGLQYNIISGLVEENVARHIVYPLNSHTRRLNYDSTAETAATATDVNLYRASPASGNVYGINYTDLKPAIKNSLIITAIENKYGITFNKDDFLTSTAFSLTYLLLHRNKGAMIGGGSLQSKIIYYADWTPNALPYYPALCTEILNASYEDIYYDLQYTITPVPISKKYDIVIKDEVTGTTLASYTDLTGVQVKTISIYGEQCYEPSLTISTSDGVTSFTPSLFVTKYVVDEFGSTTTTTNTYTTSPASNNILSTIIIGEQLPKIKTIDYLTSLFKMFNLTAYVLNGEIRVKDLDDFYSAGVNYDITKYVDVLKSDVNRALPYRVINFKYQEPSTLLAKQFKELNNKTFGDLIYDSGNIFDGGSYDINLDFEHLLYERLNDSIDNSLTGIGYGFFVDDKQDPVLTKPVVFYNEYNTITTTIGFENITGTGLTTFNRMSNVAPGSTRTLNFGSEIDEYALATNDNGLYNKWYDTFITSVFNIKARIIKVKAFLPLSILLNYTLADRFIISGKIHKINNITTNLQTGESEIELINEV